MSFFADVFSPLPKTFGAQMADRIERQFPAATESKLVKAGARRRLEGVLNPIKEELETFQRTHRLGWIGKAKLANEFRWAMTEKGYSKEFVDALTEGVVSIVATVK
jgi:hypothetical protein